MKKYLTLSIIALFVVSSFGSLQLSNKVHATDDVTYAEIGQMLTEEAIKMDIPPEVAKAIALIESDWNQQKVSSVGAIGIMQVYKPEETEVYKTKLKEDIRFNIQEGLKILDGKYKGEAGKLPLVNDGNRDLLESWYFAILAYSGAVQVNSPIYLSENSTDRNMDAYQEKVYKAMMVYNGITSEENYKPIPFKFELKDFSYGDDDELYFETYQYNLPQKSLHKTSQNYKNQDILVTAANAKFREFPSTYNTSTTQINASRVPITITSDRIYDQSTKNGLKDKKMIYKHYVWYKTTTENGKEAYISSGDMLQLGQRLSGANRYTTANAISQEGWPNGADTVVVARGDDYPDALAGTPLAYELDAPMLLTEKSKLTGATKEELERLKAKKVILLGSKSAIHDRVKSEIEGMDIEVVRYGGENRFETAAMIGKELPKRNTAILAYGLNFPDALSIAPYAAKHGYPIYLTLTDRLPESTEKALTSYEKVIVVGSNGVIADKALEGISNYKRYAGLNRYATNVDINHNLPLGTNKAFVATGTNFPDALTGAVLAAKEDAPLIISTPTKLRTETESYLEDTSFDRFALLGGEDVINVEGDLANLLLNK